MAYQKIGSELEIRLAAVFSQLSKFLENAQSSFFRRIVEEKKRDEIRKLMSRADCELRDMGVSRDDVVTALALPISENASAYLDAARRRMRLID